MEKVRLSTVTEIIAGQSPPSTTYNSNGIGLPFYQGKADFGDKHPQPKIWCTEPIKIAQKNDILISVRAPVGTVNINAETSCIGRGLSAIRPLKIYGEYIFYVLKFEEKNIAKLGVGSTFSAITQKDLKEIEIPFPSYADQIRIANVLGKIEDVIQARKNAINQLDELVKATFYDIFGDPVRNEKGWDLQTIDKIVVNDKNSIRRGPFGGALKKEIFVNKGYLVYEQYHALNNDFSFERYYIDENKFEELKVFSVHPDDIIISCSGVYLGKLAIIPKDAKPGIINQALLKLTLDNSKIDNTFFVNQWVHENFKKEHYGKNIGSGIPNFPPISEFKKFKFILPPLKLQNQFAAIAQKIEKLKAEQAKQLFEMEALYASVSHAAFSGALDLTRIPYDESLLPVVETVIEPVVIDKKKEESKEIENKTSEQQKDLSDERSKDVLSSANEWRKLSFKKIAKLITNHFQVNYFNSEMLLRFLTEDAKVTVDYFSSKEQKLNLKLENANDFLVFLSDAVNDKNPYLKLEQVFYNAEIENIKDITFTSQDLEKLSKKTPQERSGIYFRIKNETTTR